MKKEKILKVVRIALIVILCLFAVKFFIGKNINGDNDNILTAATKKSKSYKKNNSGKNSGNRNKKNSKKKKQKTEISEEKSNNTGNRKYKIDYDHIIGGDISSNGEKVTGGHTLLKGDVRIVKKIGAPSKNGVYKASVEIRRPDGSWQRKDRDRTEEVKSDGTWRTQSTYETVYSTPDGKVYRESSSRKSEVSSVDKERYIYVPPQPDLLIGGGDGPGGGGVIPLTPRQPLQPGQQAVS